MCGVCHRSTGQLSQHPPFDDAAVQLCRESPARIRNLFIGADEHRLSNTNYQSYMVAILARDLIVENDDLQNRITGTICSVYIHGSTCAEGFWEVLSLQCLAMGAYATCIVSATSACNPILSSFKVKPKHHDQNFREIISMKTDA